MWYAFSGLLFGLIGGMGMGGGIVLIPVLTIFLNESQHSAQGMNLAAFLPMAAGALFLHIKQGRVEKKLCLFMCIGGALGAAMGALVATVLQAELLKQLFGGFLVLLGGVRAYKQIKKTKLRS